MTGDDNHEEGVTLEIPILPDMYGADPIEICLMLNKKGEEDEKIFFQSDANMRLI